MSRGEAPLSEARQGIQKQQSARAAISLTHPDIAIDHFLDSKRAMAAAMSAPPPPPSRPPESLGTARGQIHESLSPDQHEHYQRRQDEIAALQQQLELEQAPSETRQAFYFQRIDAASLLELHQHCPKRIPDIASGVLGNLVIWARERMASRVEERREPSHQGGGERSAYARYEAARKKEQRRRKAAALKELSARAGAGMSTPESPAVVMEHNNDTAGTDKGEESDGPAGAGAPNGAAGAAVPAVVVTGQAEVRAAPGDAASLEGEESLPTSGARKKRKLKSSSQIARDEYQQAQRIARQYRSKFLKMRRVAKLTRKGLTTSGAGHNSCKRAGGIAKAKRASRQAGNDASNRQEAEGSSAHAAHQVMCKFWLTPSDKALVLGSITLPHGMTQKVESCVNERCPHAHTDDASATNRERLIQTRKRKVAMLLRPRQTQLDDEERQGWLDFDFTKGWGFIKPVKITPGRDPRRQKLFFHITDWKGTTPLQQREHVMPLRVRYHLRVLNHRELGSKYKAVQVSACGPSKRHKPAPTGPPKKKKKHTATSRASDKTKKQKAKKKKA